MRISSHPFPKVLLLHGLQPPWTIQYHYSPNNTNGGHFAEWSYCTHNGHTQSTAMASGVWEHKWGLLKYLRFSSVSGLCPHAQNFVPLQFSFTLPGLVRKTICCGTSLYITTPTHIPRLIKVQRAWFLFQLRPPSPPPPTCPCLSHRACFQSNFPRLNTSWYD